MESTQGIGLPGEGGANPGILVLAILLVVFTLLAGCTRTVIYLEDSPARYLRITKGNPNIVLAKRKASALPNRKEQDYPRRLRRRFAVDFQN